MRSVGIDIGSSSIKIAEVSQTTKGLVITQIFEHTLGQNPAFDPEIEILDFLRTSMARFNPETCQIVVGLRQDEVAVRNKIFPFNDRNKILKSLPFELEEDLPFSPENAIYDAKIVATLGTSAEVLACATPSTRIAQLLSRLRSAGIEPHIVSAEGIALANCWEKWNEPPPTHSATAIQIEGSARPERQIHLVIEIGHTRTIVCGFDGSNLVGVRSILWGGKNIAEAISKKYEITFVEALKILKQQAFVLPTQENANYDQIIFSETICESAKELAQDLQMTILEFQTEFNGTVINANLTGGISQIQNFHTFLTRQLEVSTNPTKVLTGNFTLGFNLSPSLDANSGVAVGLAIEGLKRPRNPAMNFLKGEFQKQNKKIAQAWEKWSSLTKTLIIIVIGFSVFSFMKDQVSSSLIERSTEALKKQAKQIARLPEKKSSEENIKKFIKEQRQKTNDIQAIQQLSKMNSALDILKKISENVPGKNTISLTVKRIHIQNTSVEIEGVVAKSFDITPLQKSLSTIALNGKISPMKTTLLPSSYPAGNTPFAFTFQVDREIGQFVSKAKTGNEFVTENGKKNSNMQQPVVIK